MATIIDSLVVQLTLDAQPFQKGQQQAEAALNDLKGKATGAGQAIEKTEQALNKTGKTSEGSAQKIDKTNNALDGLSDKATDAEKALDKVDEAFDDVSEAAEKTGKEVKGTGEATQKTGKNLEETGDKGSDAFRKVSRQALAFIAVLTAGKGIKSFTADTIHSNVALANNARNIRESAGTLGAWQRVAQATGNTAEDVSGSIGSMLSQSMTPEGNSQLSLMFAQLGVKGQKANGELKQMSELIPELAAAAKRVSPQFFNAVMRQSGVSQGFINMLEEGPDKLRDLYSALKDSAPTDEDVKASQQLLRDWTELTAQSEKLGRTLLTSLAQPLHTILTDIIALEKEHPKMVSGLATGGAAVGGFLAALIPLMTAVSGYKFLKTLSNLSKLADVMKSGGGKVVADVVKEAPKVGMLSKVARFGVRFLGPLGTALMAKDMLNSSLGKDDMVPRNSNGRHFAVDNPEAFNTFAASVAKIENAAYNQRGGYNNAYLGKYQMSTDAIKDGARVLGISAPTSEQFLSDPALQERLFAGYTKSNEMSLDARNSFFRNSSDADKLALLAYAHNQGAGGASQFIKSGESKRDGFGTDARMYYDSVKANLAAQNAAMAQASVVRNVTHGDTTTTTNSHNLTINATGANASEVRNALKTAFSTPQFQAKQNNVGMM